MDWFGDLDTKDDVDITEVSEKIEKIINDNSYLFNNFPQRNLLFFLKVGKKENILITIYVENHDLMEI